MKKTVPFNPQHRRNGKLLGGITGKGFVPGRSGNPHGRSLSSKGLPNSLKAKIAEVAPNGRTVEELLVEALIQEAFVGKNRMAALASIFDRLEGKAWQQPDFNNVSRDVASRRDDELRPFLAHGHWPEESCEGQANGIVSRKLFEKGRSIMGRTTGSVPKRSAGLGRSDAL